MYIIAAAFLVWAWRGAKRTMPRTFIPLIAVISSVILFVQLVEFPVAGGGSTWHFMGGTIVSMILGPFGATISLTITLLMQLVLGDGGITSFGANIFNMAVIGALSFFLVKVFVGSNFNEKRLAAGVFAAAWISNVLTALAVGIEIGIYPLAGQIGGVMVTVPTMMVWYVPTGLLEGVVAAALILPLSRLRTSELHGLNSLRLGRRKNEQGS
jgi:cobalt/nickel transport system permease protein